MFESSKFNQDIHTLLKKKNENYFSYPCHLACTFKPTRLSVAFKYVQLLIKFENIFFANKFYLTDTYHDPEHVDDYWSIQPGGARGCNGAFAPPQA